MCVSYYFILVQIYSSAGVIVCRVYKQSSCCVWLNVIDVRAWIQWDMHLKRQENNEKTKRTTNSAALYCMRHSFSTFICIHKICMCEAFPIVFDITMDLYDAFFLGLFECAIISIICTWAPQGLLCSVFSVLQHHFIAMKNKNVCEKLKRLICYFWSFFLLVCW